MKHNKLSKKAILPIFICALSALILCLFLLPSARSSVPAESYAIAPTANSQPLTEEEKQEKYQTYLKTILTEELQTFSGENIQIEPVFNDKKEITGITLISDNSGRLEEDVELQIVNFLSTAYELDPDSISFSYQ